MSTMYSDPDSMATALFGQPSSAALDYLRQGVDRYIQQARAIPNLPSYIAESVMSSYNSFRSLNMGHHVQALRSKIHNYWEADVIRPVTNVHDMQQLRPNMARWVMAHPGMRELYHEERIEGYGKHYVDPAPGVSGEAFYDTRRAVEGVIRPLYSPEGEFKGQGTRHYVETLIGSDRVLSHLEKSAINITWGAIDENLEEGIYDPSSEWNGTIG